MQLHPPSSVHPAMRGCLQVLPALPARQDHRYDDSRRDPAADRVPADWRNKILHARMNRGDQVLMGSDVAPGRFEQPKGFSVSIQIHKPEGRQSASFAPCRKNGEVQMPMA